MTATGASSCIFQRHPRLYALWRDHLFRDDTQRICASLWSGDGPAPGQTVVELGCGPGFYVRRLAARYGAINVLGVDHSAAQLRLARRAAAERGLDNCSFELADVCALPLASGSADGVVVSRLLSVIADRQAALAEMHRILRPGGRLFLAEPRSALRAGLPLAAMRLIDGAVSLLSDREARDLHDAETTHPDRVRVMDGQAFRDLTDRLPWASVSHSADRWYQYAVCERAA